jgi:hypothetical protein
VRYPDQQMVFTPAPNVAGLSKNWRSAYRACFAEPPCWNTGDAVVALAVATGPPGYPRRSDPTDMTGKFFNQQLVYVITWDPAPCRTEQTTATTCRVVNFVDTRSRYTGFAIEIADSQPVISGSSP